LRWLQAKTDGLFGEIAPATAADYRSCIERHLLPIFGDCALEEIDRARCLRLKARLLSDARELREALTAGREMRDERRRPLGPASARKVLTALGAILDDAVEDDLIESNPARGKRMRVRVAKPNRTFLEMDELALLLDAAGIGSAAPGHEAAAGTRVGCLYSIGGAGGECPSREKPLETDACVQSTGPQQSRQRSTAGEREDRRVPKPDRVLAPHRTPRG
jgi:hypothetical protein